MSATTSHISLVSQAKSTTNGWTATSETGLVPGPGGNDKSSSLVRKTGHLLLRSTRRSPPLASSTAPAARQAYLLSAARKSSKATFIPPSSSSPWAKGPDYIAHSRFLVARMGYIGYDVLKTYDQYASLHKARRDLDALDCEVYRQRLTINPLVWLLCIYVGSTHMQTIADRNRYYAAKFKAVMEAEAKGNADAVSAAQGSQKNLYRTRIMEPPLHFVVSTTTPLAESALSHLSPSDSSPCLRSSLEKTSTVLVAAALRRGIASARRGAPVPRHGSTSRAATHWPTGTPHVSRPSISTPPASCLKKAPPQAAAVHVVSGTAPLQEMHEAPMDQRKKFRALEQATKDAKALELVDAHKVEPIKKIDNVKTEMELDADDEKEVDELLAPATVKIEDGVHEDEEVDELAYLPPTSRPMVTLKLPTSPPLPVNPQHEDSSGRDRPRDLAERQQRRNLGWVPATLSTVLVTSSSST